jgi:hypothetical protein
VRFLSLSHEHIKTRRGRRRTTATTLEGGGGGVFVAFCVLIYIYTHIDITRRRWGLCFRLREYRKKKDTEEEEEEERAPRFFGLSLQRE